MTRTRILLIIAALLVLTSLAAAVDKTVGERLDIWDGPVMEFDAHTPFHITHGYSWGFIRPGDR